MPQLVDKIDIFKKEKTTFLMAIFIKLINCWK